MTDGPALRPVLDALPYGIAVIDGASRLAYTNAGFWRLVGVDAALCPPGTALRDLVRMLCYRGFYGAGDPEAQTVAVMAVDRSRPSVRRLRLLDGTRMVEIASVPLPGGAFATCAHEITDLVQAGAQAQDRVRLAENVLASLSGGVIAYDGAHRVTLANAAMETLTGCLPGSIRPGMTHRDVLAAQVARGEFINTDAAAEVAERLARNRAVHSVRQRERPDGSVLRLESHPLADGGFVVEVNDITALKRAEDEARRRAAVLDGVLEALPHGVVVFGPDRRAVMFNAAYARIMSGTGARIGETVEDLVARRRAEGEYDEATAAQVLLRFAATAEGEAARRAGMYRVRRDGTAVDNRMARLPDGGIISVFTDVTALHRAEEDARARAALLDAVLDALPDGVVVYDADRRARMANAAYRRIMGEAGVRIGETLEEVAARRVASGELTRELADELLCRHSGPVEQTGRPIRRVRANGTAILTRAGRLPDGGHIAVISDITALHRAEEELQRRAALLEASFAAIRHGIAIFGPDHRLLAWNDRTADLSGIPLVHHAVGRSMAELVEEQVATGVLSAAQAEEAALIDRARPHRVVRARDDGRLIEMLSDPTPDGGFVVTFTDVTALHRAEAEAQHRAAMLEAMLGTIRHGIIMYGPDRRLLAANAKAAELTGLPAGRMRPGRSLDELIDETVQLAQLSPQAGAEMKAMDRDRPQRYWRHKPDGRVLDVASDPTPDGGFVITYGDVTDEQRIRAELQAAREAAEAGSAAKSRFLATMSHELRTPLNAVIGFSEAIAGEADRARIEDYAAAINDAGRQLLLVIDDILDVARSQTGALAIAEEPVAIAPLLQAAARDMAPAAKAAGLALELVLPDGLPALRGDPRRLAQVLHKLLSNAVKFTPAGGRVSLSAGQEAGGVAIRVADSGIGIPPGDRERSFEPFTQLDGSLARRFQGSGLGLHLARSLATALGGTLTLEDAEGPGIVAVLRFPAARLVQPATAR
ncbi:PAS-domain containing protein [Falsiroseomonas sp. CW058]|uniref:PAS-domain containing protein n=1 Tax=Falsiroseomonas sp. CW058 TaxID=3388664 RepID=UPI003D314492